LSRLVRAKERKKRQKKKKFKKIVFDIEPTGELEEGEIVSDNEGDDVNESGRFKSAGNRVEAKIDKEFVRRPPVHARLGLSEVAQLKADLSELLFMQPNRRMAVSAVFPFYRFSFNRGLPVDCGYTTEDLIFSLNLFCLKWEGEQRVVKWDSGKFLANFRENAEDLLQAKECIPLNQFLPLYLKVFGHNISAEAFLEMCVYPCTRDLLTACCPSIWVPEFDHQMLRMCNTVDYSDYSTVDYEYASGKKICNFFLKGWCKFGHLCLNVH